MEPAIRKEIKKETTKPKKRMYENDERVIWFKSNKGNGYAWLSNFWPDVSQKSIPREIQNEGVSPFILDEKPFKSVEHYFHASKYKNDPVAFEDIRSQPTAVDAKKRNTFYKKKYPIDIGAWNENRDSEMKRALFAKFSQNKALKKGLLGTGTKRLFEVPGRGRDRYWQGGVGGGNHLGILLEQVRDQIRQVQ